MKFLIILIGLAIATQVSAQSVCVIEQVEGSMIQGMVVSGEDKLYPVKSASIKVFRVGQSNREIRKVKSDSDGRFVLGALPNGKFEIAFSYPGTVTLFVPVRISPKKQEADIIVKLGVLIGVPCGGGEVEIVADSK